ncbi:CLUMA_CG013091, isoform A [Clunio marinus]|uniref:CLUMA_CG013091, isoform A n=1 Tax=Clunio marinus TaxID=568069 RepID=A0A1J1IHP5_9DIPT|nr:CLUMA_CG013091, isoform A [Clunio marinus]
MNDRVTENSSSVICDSQNKIEEDILIKIIELKEEIPKSSKAKCWEIVSKEFNITIEECKKIYTNAISRYKISEFKDDSEIGKLLTQHGEELYYDYCMDNFSNLCRFCCRVNTSSLEFLQIYDDSSDDQLLETNQFIDQIHHVFHENILEKVDLKMSNLICYSCKTNIQELSSFLKRSEFNAEILSKVQTELESFRYDLESHKSNDHEIKESDNLEEENDQTLQSLERSINEDDDIEEVEEMTDEEQDVEEEISSKSSKRFKVLGRLDKVRKSYRGKNSQCQVCGKLVKGIQIHMLTHTGEKRHKCSYCSKSFTQSGQLKRHVNSHLNIRNYKCPEPGCERTFVDPSSVTKHLVVHNKEDRKYQCSLCGARFNRLGALRYHEKTHRQERNHSCDICEKTFLAKYDLTKHYRTHTGEKPYSCKYCDKKFSISKNAKVHLRVHTKEKPYSCKFCDLSFAYRSSMKNHLIKIHNHADTSNLPLLQAINIAIRSDSENNEMNRLQQQIAVDAMSLDSLGMEVIELEDPNRLH